VRILIPLPDKDFDVTEVSVPWRVLTDAGHTITFATERGGTAPEADPLLLCGVIPGWLGMFRRLGADPQARRFYRQLIQAPTFRTPIAWADIEPDAYDGLILPGGHAPGMRQYLEGATLRQKVAQFWSLDRPVGAICHGVIVLVRTLEPSTGRSLIASRRTTCLPGYLERSAYYLTAWRLGRYYRTYPAYVEDEVKAALDDPGQFERGPWTLRRGTADNDGPAFVVRDGRYLSARWPGDAYLFAKRFHTMVSFG
jgi:putative intracellular protease/amidase